MRLWTQPTVTFCLLIALAGVIHAQTPKPKQLDAATLRSRFVSAFGQDFELVKDEMKTRSVASGGGKYWLAFVKPKRTGYFFLQYRYTETFQIYSREHEFRMDVGPQGCRRGSPQSQAYTRFCLGDTIIIPVLVNNYTEHQFNLTRADYTDAASTTFEEQYPGLRDQKLDASEVPNPAAENLRYIGRSSYKALHRIPGYTLGLGAVFEAVKPGRFNLMISSEHLKSAASTNVSIIVVDRNTPLTLVAGREQVNGLMAGSRARVVSTTDNNFMVSVIILQPGDRISVPYFSVVRQLGSFSDGDTPDPDERVKPVITVLPFAVGRTLDFTEWIMDYLPPVN